MARSLPTLWALAVAMLVCWLPGVAEAQRENPRVIVLSFEGWRAETARRLVAEALGLDYTVVSEDDAVSAADQLGVDVGSPEGMAAVVRELRIDLVVGGSVRGTGRRSTLSLFVLDATGNELSTAEVGGPSGGAANRQIGDAALEAAQIAIQQVHPPEPEPEPEPEGRSLEDLENERPDGSGGGSSWGDPDAPGPREERDPNRWNQPVFRGQLLFEARNRTAQLNPGPAGASYGFFPPSLGLSLDTRPFANQDDALRGLYAQLDLAFSLARRYIPFDGSDPIGAQAFNFELDLGYAGTVAEMVEILGTIGIGYDMFAHTVPDNVSAGDLPTVGYTYLPLTVGARIRLLPASMEGMELNAELAGGPRILLGAGDVGGAAGSNPYFESRGGMTGHFGSAGGVGVNVWGGLNFRMDPGLLISARFQYIGYFLGFSNGSGTRAQESGTDESMHIQLLAGWALR